LVHEERENRGALTHRSKYMAKILDAFLQIFIANSYHIHTSTLSSFMMIFCTLKVQCCQKLACFLFGSCVKDIFISSNVTQNVRNALIYSILRAFTLLIKTSPHVQPFPSWRAASLIRRNRAVLVSSPVWAADQIVT